MGAHVHHYGGPGTISGFDGSGRQTALPIKRPMAVPENAMNRNRLRKISLEVRLSEKAVGIRQFRKPRRLQPKACAKGIAPAQGMQIEQLRPGRIGIICPE